MENKTIPAMPASPSSTSNSAVASSSLKNIAPESKQVLIEKIKTLLTIDNELNAIKHQKKDLETKKKELTKDLIAIMKSNEFTTLSTKTDTLKYKVTRTKVLGKQQLTALLNEFYKNDVEKAEEIRNFIFDNLKERVAESIVRKGHSISADEET